MKIEIDAINRLAYVYVQPKSTKVHRSMEVEGGVILDMDEQDGLVGIELLDVEVEEV